MAKVSTRLLETVRPQPDSRSARQSERKARLTKRVVERASAARDRDVWLWDTELRGFGVRIKPSGVRSYVVQYRNAGGRTRRLALGRHGVLTAEQARDMARQRLADAKRGVDP